MFIRGVDGTAYNADTIAKLEYPYAEVGEVAPYAFHRLTGVFHNGSTFETYRKDVEALVEPPLSVIPATSGTYTIVLFENELHRTPVSGWLVYPNGRTMALRMHGFPEEDFDAILLPNGEVWDPVRGAWTNQEAYRIFRMENDV